MWNFIGRKGVGNAGKASNRRWMKKESGEHVPLSMLMAIKPEMQVVTSCGCPLGKVESLEGGAIKITEMTDHHPRFFVPVR